MRMSEQEFAAWKQRQETLGVKVTGTPKAVTRTAQVTQEEKAACVAPLPVAKGETLAPKFKSKTEAEYHRMLELRQKAGEIVWFRHEGITLDLGGSRYTVDFFVLEANGELSAWEIKGGYIRPDSMVKLKIAASMFPFKFHLAQKTKTGWVEKRV